MEKRLFFALEIHAPWPPTFPPGRILEENDRHLTIAFLGDTDWQKLETALPDFPLQQLQLGIVGQFDQCLFLPFAHPHVVSWHIKWQNENNPLPSFQKEIFEWLTKSGFSLPKRDDFLPHVTIARPPFEIKKWKKAFLPLPCFAGNIHLFESLGFSKYRSLWMQKLHSPFEEMDHVADIAYLIRGHDLYELYIHAFTALCFSFPPLLSFYLEKRVCRDMEEIVMDLNEIVSLADEKVGCPFKAVSFHGKIKHLANGLLEWEMIVDV